MIFVTVGTADFDQLVEKMDGLAASLHDQVIIQIGMSKYVPQNCEYFRFAPTLDPYYEQADVVVAHGGLATTMEVLEKGKKLISVENKTCIDGHQHDILQILSQEECLIWCQDLDELPSLVERLPTINLRPYVVPPCQITDIVRDFLDKLE